jgi:hypothetical protein
MASHWIMQEHKLLELNDIIEDRIGSLQEEVEIATNVKINSLYLIHHKMKLNPLSGRQELSNGFWIEIAMDGKSLE